MSAASALTLLVHDYDALAADKRGHQLREVLPQADVRCFSRRDEFLAAISEIDPAPPEGPWPLALIDLHDRGTRAPGEHLLGTINEHPDSAPTKRMNVGVLGSVFPSSKSEIAARAVSARRASSCWLMPRRFRHSRRLIPNRSRNSSDGGIGCRGFTAQVSTCPELIAARTHRHRRPRPGSLVANADPRRGRTAKLRPLPPA